LLLKLEKFELYGQMQAKHHEEMVKMQQEHNDQLQQVIFISFYQLIRVKIMKNSFNLILKS
jgi:hypothetical protein